MRLLRVCVNIEKSRVKSVWLLREAELDKLAIWTDQVNYEQYDVILQSEHYGGCRVPEEYVVEYVPCSCLSLCSLHNWNGVEGFLGVLVCGP